MEKIVITAAHVKAELKARGIISDARGDKLWDPRRDGPLSYAYLEEGYESDGVEYPTVKIPRKGNASGAFCAQITAVIEEMRKLARRKAVDPTDSTTPARPLTRGAGFRGRRSRRARAGLEDEMEERDEAAQL